MAGRFDRPSLNSSGIFLTGHFCWHTPQPLHSFSSILRALRRMVALKLPMKPSSFSSSE